MRRDCFLMRPCRLTRSMMYAVTRQVAFRCEKNVAGVTNASAISRSWLRSRSSMAASISASRSRSANQTVGYGSHKEKDY